LTATLRPAGFIDTDGRQFYSTSTLSNLTAIGNVKREEQPTINSCHLANRYKQTNIRRICRLHGFKAFSARE